MSEGSECFGANNWRSYLRKIDALMKGVVPCNIGKFD